MSIFVRTNMCVCELLLQVLCSFSMICLSFFIDLAEFLMYLMINALLSEMMHIFYPFNNKFYNSCTLTIQIIYLVAFRFVLELENHCNSNIFNILLHFFKALGSVFHLAF